MTGYLLDVNLLIALAWPNHAQHEKAQHWFRREQGNGWGTCLLTQTAFIRISSHETLEFHVSPQEAFQKLLKIVALPNHRFLPEPENGYAHPSFSETMANTLTHRSVTDGYLATLASIRDHKLATLDRQLV